MGDEELLTSTQSRVLPVQYASDESFVGAWDPATNRLGLPLPEGPLTPGLRVAVWVRVGQHPGRVIVKGAIGPAAGGHPSTLEVRDGELERLHKAVSAVRASPESPLRDERYVTEDPRVDFTCGGVRQEGRVRNVSDGGCFVLFAGAPPAIGSEVQLEIRPPRAFFRIRVRGEVTWHDAQERSRGFGLRFEPGQGDRVEKFLYAALVAP